MTAGESVRVRPFHVARIALDAAVQVLAFHLERESEHHRVPHGAGAHPARRLPRSLISASRSSAFRNRVCAVAEGSGPRSVPARPCHVAAPDSSCNVFPRLVAAEPSCCVGLPPELTDAATGPLVALASGCG